MKALHTLAGASALALVAASTLLLGSAASAATVYITADDFGVEGTSYPDQWFVGEGSTGTITSDESGLTLDGKMQILNGDTPATGLLDLVGGADIQAAGDATALAQLKFQVSIFGDPTSPTDKAFTTLYPEVAGSAGLGVNERWITSAAIPATATTPAYVKSAEAPLVDLEAALAAINPATGYEVLAFGATLAEGYSATISSITWAGNTHLFTPEPGAGPLPTEPPVLQTAPDATPDVALPAVGGDSGATHDVVLPDGTFQPYENVFVTWYSTPLFGGWYQANAAGGLSITVTVPTTLAPGTHTLQITGSTSGITANGSFSVALAATGTDITSGIAGGGMLLLVGFGLAVVAMRRRSVTH